MTTAVGTSSGQLVEFWAVDSRPFAAADGAQPVRIVLRQVDDGHFSLVEGVMVTAPASLPGRPQRPLVIEASSLRTDLASIPAVVGWFARRHGRHTPAAVVHDFLITSTPLPPTVPDEWRLRPERADLLFRELLLASGVPPVRSYVMWAAAAARTRWIGDRRRRAALAAWGLAAVAGTVALVAGVARGNWTLAGAAALAPALGAVLWGGQYLAGLVAGYSVWWALAGAAPAWLAFKAYQGVEGVVWLARRLRQRRARAAAQPPPPVAYDQR